MPDLRKVQRTLEDMYAAQQAVVEEKAKIAYADNADEAVNVLTGYGMECADRMMKQWDQLFRYLVVKHNDMVVKKEADGKFKKTPYGYCEPVERPGYSEEYWKRVVDETGTRYQLK